VGFLPPLPAGFVLEDAPQDGGWIPGPPRPAARDPFALAREAGFNVTNGYRTPADQDRLRRAGYNPAPNSAHLRGDAMDLVHPRMSPDEMVAWARQNIPEGRPLYHDNHLHLTVPGWGAAPGTPGTANSGLPALPPGFELEQRGSLSGVNWDQPALPPPAAPARPDMQGVGMVAPGELQPPAEQAPRRPQAPPGTEVAFGMDGGLPDAPAEPWSPAQIAAYDNFMRENPRATAGEIDAFMRSQGTQGVSNAAEIVRVRDLPGGGVASGSRVQLGPRPAELRAHHPDLSERAGQTVSSLLEPLMGRHAAAEQGRNTDDFLSQVTPVGAIDLGNEYQEAHQRALMEGRIGEAATSGAMRDVNYAMALPIIGAGRAAARATARRAMEQIGEAAARRGVGDVARLSDAELSGFVRQYGDDLPDDVQQFIRQGDLSENHIATIRADARPGLVQRGAAAVRRGLRGERNAADDVAGAVDEAPPIIPSIEGVSPGRAVDRIDVRDLPPLPPGFQLEDSLGRVAPLGEPIPPVELADVARSIRPGDVTPIPANRVESADEAIRANPGTVQEVPIPDERGVRGPRTVRTHATGAELPWRGPVDAETFLRSRGGIRDDGGDLAHLGITNAARSDVARDRFVGPIVNPQGMRLDDARELLAEAGFIAPDSYADEVLDVLRAGRSGSPVYRPDDMAEAAEIAAARAQRIEAEAAAADGAPIASRVGEPATLDDLNANDPPATAYEDLPGVGGTVGNINLANIETGTDIRRLLQNVETRFGGFDAARRGVITHAETRALADELGMTATDLLRRRRGQALNAEQALAARQLLARSSDEVIALAGRALGPEASDASRSAFSEAMLRHAAIHEQVTGATAEAGRALQAYRMAARSRAISDRIHQAAVDGMGGQDRLEAIAQGIIDLQRQGVTPGQVNRFAVDAVRPRLRDKLIELWYNSLLSGPQTHVVNTLSNALTQTLQIPEQVVASGFGQVRRGVRALRGREDDFDRVMGSEIGPRVVGLMQGAREGVIAFGRTLRTGEVPDFVTKVESRSQRAISGLKGEIVRVPSRMLAAEDEFFKAAARRMELNGLAVRQARREGINPRVDRERFNQRVAELARNPTDEMLARALGTARYLTFQTPLGPVGSRVSAITQEHAWLKLFVPFIRTPTNIFKFAIERSPMAPLMRQVRADLAAGGERQALAVSRMMLGTGLGMVIAQMAADGTITGGGPASRSERDMLMADGWQPYSIRIGDQYYSYQRLDPLAMTLGTAAGMAESWQAASDGELSEIGAHLIRSVIGNLSDKTWLSGISDVMAAIDDPQRNLRGLTSRLAGSVAVPTGVAQVTRWMDPVQRETRGTGYVDSALSRIQSRIPGLSDDLFPRRDVLGREVRSEGGLGPDIASPIWTRQARNDPLLAEMRRIGVNIGRPARRARGGQYNSFDYDRLQETAGRYALDDLRALMASPAYGRMTDDERREEARRVITRSRRDARRDLYTPVGAPRGAGANAPGARREALPPLPPGFQLER